MQYTFQYMQNAIHHECGAAVTTVVSWCMWVIEFCGPLTVIGLLKIRQYEYYLILVLEQGLFKLDCGQALSLKWDCLCN